MAKTEKPKPTAAQVQRIADLRKDDPSAKFTRRSDGTIRVTEHDGDRTVTAILEQDGNYKSKS